MSYKIHAICDAQGRPTTFVLTPGQASDLAGADTLLPQVTAKTVIGDKGYDADKRVRDVLVAAGKTAVIPGRCNRVEPIEYDEALYKERHKIENFFGRLKDYRSIATRYEKTARNFLAGIYLAAILFWIN